MPGHRAAAAIGGHKLAKLSPLHIQAMYRQDLQGHRLDNREGGLSPRTVLQHHRILKKALGQAVRWRLLPVNPAEAVDATRYHQKEMSTITAPEAALLLEASAESRLHLPILLAVTTGMRKGEILGLQWKDVDFEKATLQVRRSAEYTKNGFRLKEPKTARGRRVISLPAMAVEALRHHKIQQNDYRLKLGPDYTDLDLICCLPDGRPVKKNVLRDFHALLMRYSRRLAFLRSASTTCDTATPPSYWARECIRRLFPSGWDMPVSPSR